MAENQSTRGGNTVGTFDGYQDLDTGLQYNQDGSLKDTKPLAGDEIQVDKIGVFERRVHPDGSVTTLQVEAITPSDGTIQTPVPLPGEKQDQANTGQTTDVKSDSPNTKATNKK